MPELITRDGGQISSLNFMRLVKRAISDGIIDGCAISKSGSEIYIKSGHIVACGALVEVEDMSVKVSSSGELILRISMDGEKQAQIIARTSSNLTQQDLTNGGKTYETRLATYTYGSGSITQLTVGSGSSSQPSGSPSGGTSSGGGTTSSSASGILTSKVSSTVSSPTVHYSAKYSATREGSALSVDLTFIAWLNSSASNLGTGSKLTIYARVNNGAWKSVVIKNTSASWSGTSEHSAVLSLTATSSTNTVTVDFYVTRSGSTYSGTAGNLGSAGSPKSYTINLT